MSTKLNIKHNKTIYKHLNNSQLFVWCFIVIVAVLE